MKGKTVTKGKEGLKKFKEEMTPEKIAELRKQFFEIMDANKERVVDQFIRALWRGIGKLDDEAARLVYREIHPICLSIYLPCITEVIGFDITSEPMDLETMVILLDIMENIQTDGKGKVTLEGNVVTDESCYLKCGCPWVDRYGVVEHNGNQCKNCGGPAYSAYFAGMLKVPAQSELINSVMLGGKACLWKIKV